MPQELSTGSSLKWDVEKDRFTGKLLAWEEREFKDTETKELKRSHVLTFALKDGQIIDRNSTTAWDRWMGRDVRRDGNKNVVTKVKPVLHLGDVVQIKSMDQVQKGKRRFFNFKLVTWNAKDPAYPAWAKKL